jgi:F0F1-type ATP synthase membrane subunit b/b'
MSNILNGENEIFWHLFIFKLLILINLYLVYNHINKNMSLAQIGAYRMFVSNRIMVY